MQLGVIALGDSLGLHLDCQVAAGALNAFADVDNRVLQALNADRLIQAGARQNIQRGRYQLDLDLGIGGVAGLGGAQGSLNGVDALVAEAGDLDIGTDLGGLGSETLADISLEFLGDGLAGEGNVVPNLGVAVIDALARIARVNVLICPYVMDSLKASMAWPYLRLSGQAMLSYRDSMGTSVFSATCRIME